jgi:hypothetical protein
MSTIQIVTTFGATGDERQRFIDAVIRIFGQAGLVVLEDGVRTKMLPIRERDGRAEPEMMHAYVKFTREESVPGNEERVAFATEMLEKLTTWNEALKTDTAGKMHVIYYNAKSYWKIRLLEDRPARSALPKFE